MEVLNKIKSKIQSALILLKTPDNVGEAELMQDMNELQSQVFYKTMQKTRKSKKVAFFLSLFLGVVGGHRYYVGDYAIGVVWTIIGGLIGNIKSQFLMRVAMVAALVDFLLLLERLAKYNREQSLQISEKVKASENPYVNSSIEKASEYAASQNFEAAIKELNNALAMPNSEANTAEIQKKLSEYQTKWDTQRLLMASEYITKNDFKGAISVLEKITPTSESYQEAQKKITEYLNDFHAFLLQDAENKASQGNFSKALETLKKIPNGTEAYFQAQSKIAEYEQAEKARLEQQALEREIREQEQKERQASQWLESAINQATKGNFSKALETLKKIPNGTEAYFQAQSKISEYEQVIKNQILEQQRIEKEKEELIAKSKNLVALTHNGKRVAAALVDKTIHIVDSVTRKITISGVFGETTFADGEFVIINLVVRNEDKKSRNISASMITLIDSEGREFQTSSTAMTALTMSGEQKAELWSTQIQPGLDKDITIVFDIPPTAQDLKLKVPSGLFGQPAILPLSLAL
ncbi:MAG TPA: hypothetical protein DCS91_08825 [Microcoleaceae bacterium UBA11344]|nr:hypothetical protein [Microcoleaceae cyanobacterium UBA11344]